jgi:hypothetical protein
VNVKKAKISEEGNGDEEEKEEEELKEVKKLGWMQVCWMM